MPRKIWDVGNEALRNNDVSGLWKLTILTSLVSAVLAGCFKMKHFRPSLHAGFIQVYFREDLFARRIMLFLHPPPPQYPLGIDLTAPSPPFQRYPNNGNPTHRLLRYRWCCCAFCPRAPRIRKLYGLTRNVRFAEAQRSSSCSWGP